MNELLYEMSYFENFMDVYCGNDENNYYFIAIESNGDLSESYTQKTQELEFRYNVLCKLTINNVEKEGYFHMLICKSFDKKHLQNFKRLILSFIHNEDYHNYEKINDLFSSFLSMFSKQKSRSYEDFESFFSELYFIYFMKNKGIDVSKYWQSKEKMKFDYNFNEKSKIDIKSTSKPNRIHHFLHEQLASDIFDIKIVSFKMRTTDKGMSINSLISKVREMLVLPLHVEKYINNYISNTTNYEQLDELLFDEIFLLNNIAFYDAIDVPKFNCKQPNGVTKTEYDSDLSLSNEISIDEVIKWIEKNI